MVMFDCGYPITPRGKLENNSFYQRGLARVLPPDDMDYRREILICGMPTGMDGLIAGDAERRPVDADFAPEVDAFAALAARHAISPCPRHIFRRNLNLLGLDAEQELLGYCAVSNSLCLVAVGRAVGVKRHLLPGIVSGDNTDGFLSFKVHKGGGHLAIVEKFKAPAAKGTSGNGSNSISGAAVNLNINDNLF